MADMMQFDLVSPERQLASGKVASVEVPGSDGDMTVMPDHAATITTLRPGIIKVAGSDGTSEYVVTGGFAEISPDGVTVLAERAVAREDMTQETFDDMMKEAHSIYTTTRETFKNEPGPVDDAAKLLADMVAVGTHIGLDSKQPNL